MTPEVLKCPNCNGELEIDKNEEIAQCLYCGTKISLKKESEKIFSASFAKEAQKQSNYLELAKAAFKRNDYNEAKKYCDNAIENDADNYETWFLQGCIYGEAFISESNTFITNMLRVNDIIPLANKYKTTNITIFKKNLLYQTSNDNFIEEFVENAINNRAEYDENLQYLAGKIVENIIPAWENAVKKCPDNMQNDLKHKIKEQIMKYIDFIICDDCSVFYYYKNINTTNTFLEDYKLINALYKCTTPLLNKDDLNDIKSHYADELNRSLVSCYSDLYKYYNKNTVFITVALQEYYCILSVFKFCLELDTNANNEVKIRYLINICETYSELLSLIGIKNDHKKIYSLDTNSTNYCKKQLIKYKTELNKIDNGTAIPIFNKIKAAKNKDYVYKIKLLLNLYNEG